MKDKEAILRKSKLLRGTNILVTEDFPKRVREHRAELIRFAKEVGFQPQNCLGNYILDS